MKDKSEKSYILVTHPALQTIKHNTVKVLGQPDLHEAGSIRDDRSRKSLRVTRLEGKDKRFKKNQERVINTFKQLT